MKRTGFAVFFLIISQICLAQQEAGNSTTETSRSALPPIGDRYIREFIFVPLRSGESAEHRIIHKGLKSGTHLLLLQGNEGSEYSLVRTDTGIEGWIPTQYLVAEPPPSLQLAEAQRLIQQLTNKAGPVSEKMVETEKSNQQLLRDLKQLETEKTLLTKEIERIKSLSENAIQLDEENKRLLKEFELAKNKRDTLAVENIRLEEKLSEDAFMNGALAVIFGIFATLIIQYLVKSNKRSSEWA